jgi:hypothetical protein
VFRYSLIGLLTTILVIAVFCAALANPSLAWTRTSISLLLVTLLAATLFAMFGRGSTRPFAGGLAVVGGVFFWFFFMINEANRPPNWFDALVDLGRETLVGPRPPTVDLVPTDLTAEQEEAFRAIDRWWNSGSILSAAISLAMGVIGGLTAQACRGAAAEDIVETKRRA